MGIRLSDAERKRMSLIAPNRESPTDDECQEIVQKAFREFYGDASVLEAAVGALYLGRWLGWKALRIMHSNSTYGKYEKALNVRFKEILPDMTPHSRMLLGVRVMESVGDFWGAIVSGTVDRKRGKELSAMEPRVT